MRLGLAETPEPRPALPTWWPALQDSLLCWKGFWSRLEALLMCCEPALNTNDSPLSRVHNAGSFWLILHTAGCTGPECFYMKIHSDSANQPALVVVKDERVTTFCFYCHRSGRVIQSKQSRSLVVLVFSSETWRLPNKRKILFSFKQRNFDVCVNILIKLRDVLLSYRMILQAVDIQ